MFIVHILHTKLPEYLIKENNLADALVNFASADAEHQHFHTNAPHLHVQYTIPYRQARRIILNCLICHPLHLRQNIPDATPQALDSNHIWQMDVTHIPEIGQFL